MIKLLLHTIEEKIANFIQNNEQNFVEELQMMQIWDQPLIGLASASDPLWKKLKESSVIGPDHLTPEEWLPGAKSVISYTQKSLINQRFLVLKEMHSIS